MSLCCGSLWLLVLLGAAMAFGSPVRSEERFNNLLRLKEVEVGSKPLFNSVVRKTMCQTDMQLVNATLDVYMRIFSSILQHDHHGPDPALLKTLTDYDNKFVYAELMVRKQKMEELRGKLGELNHDNEITIHHLNNIKVDVPLEQRKALAEFNLVYKALSHCNSSVH